MNDHANWTHIPSPGKVIRYQDGSDLPHELVNILLDIIQDGLCIVDRKMELVYSNLAMQYWYGNHEKKASRENKCYVKYHGRKEPCENCPALKAFEQGTPQTGMQILEKNGKVTGRQRLFCVPLLDARGEVFLVVEYVRDITDEKLAESSVQLLEKQNALLQEHLWHSHEETRRAQDMMALKVNYIVNAIKQSLSSLLDEKNYLRIEKQIDRLLDTYENRQSSLASKLSDQEKTIAKYIMEGYVSKEIAEKLNVSKKTVDYHRTNIRKKMMLGPDDNLRQRLEEELY